MLGVGAFEMSVEECVGVWQTQNKGKDTLGRITLFPF